MAVLEWIPFVETLQHSRTNTYVISGFVWSSMHMLNSINIPNFFSVTGFQTHCIIYNLHIMCICRYMCVYFWKLFTILLQCFHACISTRFKKTNPRQVSNVVVQLIWADNKILKHQSFTQRSSTTFKSFKYTEKSALQFSSYLIMLQMNHIQDDGFFESSPLLCRLIYIHLQ